jgi:hypothetical protein
MGHSGHGPRGARRARPDEGVWAAGADVYLTMPLDLQFLDSARRALVHRRQAAKDFDSRLPT